MSAYYNENNPAAAAWLWELIERGLIAPGEVDERSIEDVSAADVKGFTQCHFFAGIGGWSYALRVAGWRDEWPVWTGSCPCQPFSQAGKRKGVHDRRHLWPQLRQLIAKRRPSVCFGEQVASKDGRVWITGVRSDLEALGYAVGAADLCAAGISAPHLRQRLHWVADAQGHAGKVSERSGRQNASPLNAGGYGIRSRVADADGYDRHWWSGPLQMGRNCIEAEIERGGRKFRAQWRIKPGVSLLADGIPGRVDQLCGFGNAIVPQEAAEFIGAFMDITMKEEA